MAKETVNSPGSMAEQQLKCEFRLIATAAEYEGARVQWIKFLQRPSVVAGLFTDPNEVEQRIGFDGGDFLLLGSVLRDSELVAVVPLVCRKTKVAIRFGLVTLGRMTVRTARIPDFEFPREQATDVFQVFAAVLTACVRSGQVVDLVTVDCAPVPTGDERKYGYQMQSVQTAYTVAIQGNFNAYLQAMSSKSRQTIKRKIRRFEDSAGGKSRVVSFRSPIEMDKLHEALTIVWQKSWHARLDRQHVPSIAYLKQIATHGWIRAYVLLVDEQPVASIFGFQYRGTYYYEAPSYDHDWHERSPGIVLLYYTIKNLFEVDSPARFDFGSGYGQYKQVFGTHEEQRGSLRYGISTRGKVVASLQATSDALFRWSKASLDRTGIPRLIKRKMRVGK
jgi:hypothetical protein